MARYTKFRSRIHSRHPSHDILRTQEARPLLPFKSVVRLGSYTRYSDARSLGGDRVECNTVTAIENSANKVTMKALFDSYGISTAEWFVKDAGEVATVIDRDGNTINIEDLPYPIVTKQVYGSRGQGMQKFNSYDELLNAFTNSLLNKRIVIEKFYNYNREYRLHIAQDECFYTCRKMLKNDTPEDQRWYRNDSNCVWILESNELFDKPSNWDAIVEEAIIAKNAVGLDIGAVDIRVQSTYNNKGVVRDTPKFIIIEINSAPSFGTITAEKYIKKIPEILISKSI